MQIKSRPLIVSNDFSFEKHYLQVREKDFVNPFPSTPFWDRPKFKEAADDNWNVAIKWI